MKHTLWWRALSLLVLLAGAGVLLPARAQGEVTLLAVSDMASCISDGDEAVAALLDTLEGLVISPGDNSQSVGSWQYYQDCYEPNFGRHRGRIYPVPGNHDLYQGTLDDYYAYFGSQAGVPGQGYYSFGYGAWLIIGLNSMVPMYDGSPQAQWLRATLAASPVRCTLAFFHHPVFSSGAGGVSPRARDVFRILYEAGADVIVSGDAHHYERFAPMNLQRRADPERGIRQFIVGTGGASQTRLAGRWRTTEVRSSAYGITRFTLGDGYYRWQFIPAAGSDFSDAGEDVCR
ncbi:MAG: metallophosphoesterase [Anaerolineae bacterium]|jgi:3',5'-cyclic AMP phosphodiesterase CpdA|nr:metallophosphoesterase [Anaerolineae bacterium]